MASERDEALSRRVAEQAREKEWKGSSFLRELFLGRLRTELLPRLPRVDLEHERREFRELFLKLNEFLHREVDPVAIDLSGEYPKHVIEGLARLGAFGMTIEKKYGGLGLTHREYVRVMKMLGSYDANITALLSAHQAIGVPHPVAMFGSEELKQKYLPRCARGAISAFALTEPAVGSDPARLATQARRSADGKHFVLDGHKLWCTNGTLAEVIVVLARDPDTQRINCFVVEMAWPGVQVEHRCHFMGLHALANGVIRFDGVQVPRENLIGNEGDGLRIALATLNTGRLTLPAATAGAAKLALDICRKWATVREQWGKPIGKHEAVAHGIAQLAATAYAMEAVAETVGALADMPDRDIRLEAAAAKEWNTSRGWELTDLALQIRGGRGYETESSLAARGEPPIGIERMLRDSRINRIFEGSSEIMHLFIAREAVDKHLELAGALIDKEVPLAGKLRAIPKLLAFYAVWYPMLWLGVLGTWFQYRDYGELGPHLRRCARDSMRLARSIFHGMLRYGPRLEQKQAFLFRAVDVALYLFATSAALMRAHARRERETNGVAMAERIARDNRRKIRDTLRDMWRNDDAERYEIAQHVLSHRYLWLESGTAGVRFDADDLRPQTMQEYFEAQRESEPVPRARSDQGESHQVRH
ncbi:MAG TPA: acyl-CoA dehydrogenase family protein [Polyangiales bacterium]|nr:acyl-CoA dehydrogenase family protein [Polyangiales bacterium]